MGKLLPPVVVGHALACRSFTVWRGFEGMVERRLRDLRSTGIDGLGAAMSGIRPRARRFHQVNRPASYLLEVFQQVLPQHVGPPHQLHGRSHVSPLRFFRLLDERPDPFHGFPLRRSERFARSLLQCRPGTR